MGKYLKFYKKHCETGKIPANGLCYSLGWPHELNGGNLSPDCISGYWGYNGETIVGASAKSKGLEYYQTVTREFTPLRQNIVLFLAAINGEL